VLVDKLEASRYPVINIHSGHMMFYGRNARAAERSNSPGSR